MTQDQAATIQAYAAIIQTFLAVVIGFATLLFGRIANRLLKLQTASQIEPSVTLDIHPWFAEVNEPLNYVRIVNYSPLELHEVTLSAEIFGDESAVLTVDAPAIRHLGSLPDMAPEAVQLWCIDETVEESLTLLSIGPNDQTVVDGKRKVFLRLILKYRRKSDGAPFKRMLLLVVIKKPEIPRAMVAYADYRKLNSNGDCELPRRSLSGG